MAFGLRFVVLDYSDPNARQEISDFANKPLDQAEEGINWDPKPHDAMESGEVTLSEIGQDSTKSKAEREAAAMAAARAKIEPRLREYGDESWNALAAQIACLGSATGNESQRPAGRCGPLR